MQDGWHDQGKKFIQCTFSPPLLQNTNSKPLYNRTHTWYHTHPGIDVFLSAIDIQTMENISMGYLVTEFDEIFPFLSIKLDPI